MAVKEELAALYGLQQLDSGIDALKRQFAALDPGRVEQAAYEAAKAAHDAAEKTLHTTQAEQRDAELEQKSVETKRKQYETKLYSGKVTAPKELQAIQDEVDMLARLRGKLDEKLVLLIDQNKAQQAQESETKQALTKTAAAYKAKYTVYKQVAEQTRDQAQLLQQQRAVAAKAIAPTLLKTYEALRAGKHGIAIAAIEDGNACSGCKMGLPSSIVTQVKEGKEIMLCDTCGRMLYENEVPSVSVSPVAKTVSASTRTVSASTKTAGTVAKTVSTRTRTVRAKSASANTVSEGENSVSEGTNSVSEGAKQ